MDNVYQEITARVENKLKEEFATKRDEKLLMEVFPRRENLRFYGIKVTSGSADENIKEVLDLCRMSWISLRGYLWVLKNLWNWEAEPFTK